MLANGEIVMLVKPTNTIQTSNSLIFIEEPYIVKNPNLKYLFEYTEQIQQPYMQANCTNRPAFKLLLLNTRLMNKGGATEYQPLMEMQQNNIIKNKKPQHPPCVTITINE